jgi:hypothetical protein
MKRFTLLFALMCTMAVSFGQVLQTALDVPVSSWQTNQEVTGQIPIKGGGDLIWGTTFNWGNPDDPQGWTLPSGWTVGDNTDLGNYWQWRRDTISYRARARAVPPSWFTTASDGFICLPMDDYNYRDGISTSSLADSYIQTPPINCTSVSSVVVKFNQYFDFCCSNYNLEMLVTNDAGGHWATYDVRYAVTGNITTPAKFGSVEVNISDVAAGYANVQVRFYMHGMAYYYWAIDDLRMVEAYENELVLVDTWMDFDGGADATIGQINYWPKSQMGMPGATSGTVGNYYFKAAFLNNGTADAENAKLNLQILKNGSEVQNDLSSGTTIWSLDRDTQKIDNPWLAADFGDYRFDFNAVAENGEDIPANNKASMYFTVNDTMGHRADFTAEAAMNTGGWTGGGKAGDMVVVQYPLYAPAELNSLTAYLDRFTAAETPQFQFVLLSEIEDDWEEIITSDVIDMDSSYMRRWVTLPVVKDGETEFLTPGNYRTCVRMWGMTAAGTGTSGVWVGRDLTTKFSGCPQYYSGDGLWHSLAGNPLPMIGFNINATGGPAQAPVTFNVDMSKHVASGEFKPATDFVDVAGTFNNWSGSAHLTDPEADGIYTIILEGMPVNTVIEYKYRINADWNTSEYPNGGPNRKYTVRYWNVLNNTYNSGKTTGVDPTSLTASFSVYPNPTSGAFTLDITNSAATDLLITLANIQGQVVYRNKVAQAVNHQETIDNKLSKGIYFLSVNNGKEVKVQKVIVQ